MFKKNISANISEEYTNKKMCNKVSDLFNEHFSFRCIVWAMWSENLEIIKREYNSSAH